MISAIVSTVFVPLNNYFPRKHSAIIHPRLHISTA
jgi:hypothetical protein